MTSCRTRRVTERGLKREYVHAPLHNVCGMAMPQLVNAIYPRVMSGEATLRAAIDDAVANKTKPAAAVVSPWPAIEEALKSDLIEYGNQIKAKTYEGSYGQYLKIALLHLQGRKQAQGLRANGCHVDA